MKFIELQPIPESTYPDVSPLDPGTWWVIRDDEAAEAGAPCHFAVIGDYDEVIEEYESSTGGTVSSIFRVTCTLE